uniref:Uncharacterized protein n=1 Tax=Candidatus Kentrum sp. LPFa TaxID=2126335 RepID=A0A450WIH5_9GAMM|nr:MAG: hypothetical protein BECKLPF1236B_GA0070989_11032 [Candidatus Kentron sp. LPFa]
MRIAIHPTAPNRGCCFIVREASFHWCRESSNKYFLAIKGTIHGAGSRLPCRDDGIVEFGFDFQLGVKIPDSCIKGLKRSLARSFVSIRIGFGDR